MTPNPNTKSIYHHWISHPCYNFYLLEAVYCKFHHAISYLNAIPPYGTLIHIWPITSKWKQFFNGRIAAHFIISQLFDVRIAAHFIICQIFPWAHSCVFYNFSIYPLGALLHIYNFSIFPMGAFLCSLSFLNFLMDALLRIL